MNVIDVAMLILRAWVGIVMVLHGANHARSLDGTTRWFGKVGFGSPRVNAWLSAVGEIAIGVGLAAGLLATVAAAGLAAIMLVAFWSIHRFAGFFVFNRPDEGYEYVATLAVTALVIAIVGPGTASIDHVVGIGDNLDGLVGAGIFALGLAGGAIQLALLWRRPSDQDEDA